MVPAPPWCTTARQRGYSQECGTPPSAITSRESRPGESPAQPERSTRRTPAAFAASSTSGLTSSGFSVLMLPKPTQTGGGPSPRNAASSAGGWKLFASSTNQKPVTCTSSGQSAGRGKNASLKP